MITITPAAAEQIVAAAQQNQAENMALRIAARQEMDGSIGYGMGFDDERDDDEVYVTKGVRVLVSPDCVSILSGTVLDFVEYQPGDHRFIFMNPNDRGGGCGSGGGGGCGSGGCGSGGGCA